MQNMSVCWPVGRSENCIFHDRNCPECFFHSMVWLVLGPMLHLFIEHGGAELPRLLSGDVDDF